ncbi:hypothetical protein [Ruminococcus sp.]|uniref:hypothetical protein n=1 Tax=Ruminococcus sp. TaxID=41978 RepID=UPI0025EC9AA0|nr:hypothetical protein [Ruminococcus sp.]MBQ8967588.1 hypothetical protein [Ruminococcus sp.]
MKGLVKSYTDIVSLDNEGITFSSGEKILFAECCAEDEKCVAERDICAEPPYFDFYTGDRHTKILFNRKGLLSDTVNKREFAKLQRFIDEAGYKTFDLS